MANGLKYTAWLESKKKAITQPQRNNLFISNQLQLVLAVGINTFK